MSAQSAGYRTLTTVQDNRMAACALVAGAKIAIAMFTWNLEPAIYDTDEFITAIQKFVLRRPYAHIRIVTVDPTAAIHGGHRLIELGQRLSSFVEFRRPSPEQAILPGSFLIVDETGLIYRPVADRYEGFADPDSPREVRAHLHDFNDFWERAEPESEFRRLGI